MLPCVSHADLVLESGCPISSPSGSYNAVLGVPTCLSPLIKNAREQWGFEGYGTDGIISDLLRAFLSHMPPDARRVTCLSCLVPTLIGC